MTDHPEGRRHERGRADRDRDAHRAGAEPALVMEPQHRRALGGARPGALGPDAESLGSATNRVTAPGPDAPGSTGLPAARQGSDRAATSISRRARLVSRGTLALAPDASGLLQHGVRAERGAADLLGRPRQRRG